ncbi:MAG: lipid II flippase MurJ, partial [Pseudomonadota bacterium]
MIKGFLTVGTWTLLSRVLGFVRDILIARFLGTGAAAEAFFVAFSLPNMFRRFFAEGAFNMAFVPLYAKKLEAEGAEADAFARDAVAWMVLILTLFSVLGVLFMPYLVLAMASGFADDIRFGLAVDYGRIAFPYILLISLAALVSGVLNSNGRFLAAAAAPALLNMAFITAMTLTYLFPGFVPKATPV